MVVMQWTDKRTLTTKHNNFNSFKVMRSIQLYRYDTDICSSYM